MLKKKRRTRKASRRIPFEALGEGGTRSFETENKHQDAVSIQDAVFDQDSR